MSLIYFFLFIVILIIVFIFSIGWSIIRIFLRRPKFNNTSDKHTRSSENKKSGTTDSSNKKVFKKGEGEYVDYEEIE